MITTTDLDRIASNLIEDYNLIGLVLCTIPEEGEGAPVVSRVRADQAEVMLGILLRNIATFIKESTDNVEEVLPLVVKYLIQECYNQQEDVTRFDSPEDLNVH